MVLFSTLMSTLDILCLYYCITSVDPFKDLCVQDVPRSFSIFAVLMLPSQRGTRNVHHDTNIPSSTVDLNRLHLIHNNQ